jgi:hypothetical protein
VWSEQPLELLLQKSVKGLPEPARTDLIADYNTARRFVTEEITGHIATSEPDLTDHSDRHLADVMTRVRSLIGDATQYFDAYELYILAISILFHDVGNLHGRKEHHKKVAGVYDACRRREARFSTERNAVLAIAGAHTGTTKDGSKDTLRDVGRLSFQAHPVRGQEVAALLRFADELAEGPQRTSAYLQNQGMYKPDSLLFHRYAAISDYCIDTGRIALTYNIDIEHGKAELEAGHAVLLRHLLEFSYSRIGKLDQERRYCKHYCDLLSAFKETGAWFNFFYEGQKLDLGLQPIVISDLIVPGELTKQIEDIDTSYKVSALVGVIEGACARTP